MSPASLPLSAEFGAENHATAVTKSTHF